jgi:hypothetical protein
VQDVNFAAAAGAVAGAAAFVSVDNESNPSTAHY